MPIVPGPMIPTVSLGAVARTHSRTDVLDKPQRIGMNGGAGHRNNNRLADKVLHNSVYTHCRVQPGVLCISLASSDPYHSSETTFTSVSLH